MPRKLSRSRRAIYFRKYRRNLNIRIKESLNRQLRYLIKGKVCPKIINLLGCSREDFLKYIEAQFSGDFNWENYGKKWDLDHIKELKNFDLTKPQGQVECYHYSNLRPLCKIQNKKRNKKNDSNNSSNSIFTP
jgi:hypothetical protein